MGFDIWAVYFENGDSLFFYDKEDARTYLWNYYITVYSDQDSEDELASVKNEFNEQSSIDGVGCVRGIMVY